MKLLKRSVSIALAFLMIFGSMSVLASATLGDGTRSTITFDTKFYRNNGSEWVETTKAARGDHIKVRVFSNTDFTVASSMFFWLYSKNNIQIDTSEYEAGSANNFYIGPTNVTAKGEFTCLETGPYGDLMVEYEYLPADTFETNGYLLYLLSTGSPAAFNTNDWVFEFNFTVKDDANGKALFYVPDTCFVDCDDDLTWDNPLLFGRVDDSDAGGKTMRPSSYEDTAEFKIQYELYDQDEDSTLTFTNPVKFNAGEGTFANGASEYTTGEGFIGETLSAADQPAAVTAPGGKSFVGWVPSTVDLATATAADCVDVSAIKYNYDVDTYNALYETTAATTYNFTFDPNGGAFADGSTEAKTVTVNEGEAVATPVLTRVGYEFKGWALSTVENPTVDDVVELPTAASGDASYKAVWAKSLYTVKWIVDGKSVREDSVAYGDAIPAAPSVEEKEGNDFAWSAIPETMPAADVEIVGTYTPKTYTVTWKVGDDFSATTEVKYGEALTAPEYTPAEGYDFEWVDVPATMPANDALVITGKLTAKTYKVTWVVNGEKVGETEVKYGEAIADFEYTAPVGSTFSGWTDKPETMPASDITVNGTTSTNKVTITYYLDEAETEVYYTETIDYGTAPTAQKAPSVKGKTFVDWDSDVPAALTEDVKLHAIFTDIEYTVVFEGPEGTLLDWTVTYEDSIDAIAADDAEVIGYTFTGVWNYNGTAVTFPTTAKALLGDNDAATTLKFVGVYDINVYHITFYKSEADKANGTVLFESDYEFGTDIADAVADPTMEGYTFLGWDHDPSIVEDDDEFIGQWEINTYKVTWKVNGEVVGTTDVKYGEAIADYDLTVPTGKTFSGWLDKPATMPASDITVNGTLTVNTYKITWVVDGEVVGESEFEYDEPIVQYNYTVPEGYTFGGWSEYPQFMPANDLTVSGTLTANTYNVTWKVDGEYVGTTTETFGQPIADYAYEAPEGYTFNGWLDKPETMPANESLVINGTRTAKTYKVTWKVDGEVVGTSSATFGQPIADYDYEVPEGRTFSGWLDKPATMPASDITVNGTLSNDVYNVTWKVDGEVVGTTKAAYGEAISDFHYTAPEGYTFSGWTDKPETMPASDITVNGTTTIKTYQVEWWINGEHYTTTEVKYGEAVKAPEYTIPEGYSFAWGDIPATMPDNEYLVIYGTLTIRQFTITYYLDEAEKQVYYTETIDYGTAPTAQDAPSIKGKTFVDWDSDVPAALTEDVKLHAIFTDIEYTVVFEGPEGTLLDWVVAYEDSIDAITADDAAVIGYTFTGVWNYNGAAVTFPTTAKALLGDNDAAAELKFVGVYDINVYHITFYKSEADKANGTVLFESDYEFGTDIADAVADPTMEGYTFLGWDHDPSIVEDNDEFIGQWDVNTYTVTWKVGDDFSATTEVKYGEALVAPEYTPAEGYDFEWVDVPATMPADDALVITGKLTAKTYKVTWNVNGEKVGETEVKYGEAIADYEYTAPDGFTFSGWTDKPATMPASDITVNGTTVANGYKVTWVVNGEKVGETVVAYGAAIADFEYTAPEGYTFGGWTDKPATMPANDITVNGTITANTYTIKFIDAEGNEVSSSDLAYGSDLVAPSIDIPAGMTLVGWVDLDGEAFTGKVPAKNTTYKPQIVSDDNVPYAIEIYLENVNGEYELSATTSLIGTTGQSVSAAAGEVTGFTFNAAESTLTATIAGDGSTKLVIKYSRNSYKATFDGEEYEVRYGAQLPEVTPADRVGMEFVGWVDADGNKAPATMPAGDLALTSEWKAIEYTITYIVNGQKTVETYKYGDTVVAPADPVVDNMTFTGWSMEIPKTMPAENLVIIASFEGAGTVDAYTVTFWADGVEYDSALVKVGSVITLPKKAPTKDFYVFKGWKDVPAVMPANDIDIYAEFERVPVTLIPKAGSTTVIDRDNMVIYGLQERMTEATYNSYLDVEGDGHFTVTATANGFGTGTVVELYDNVTGNLLETYHVVIFGDLNGDSRVNATDVSLATDEVLSVTNWSLKQTYANGALIDNPDYKVYMTIAADLNGDGRIDSIDTSIISNRALALNSIDQVTGRADEA